MVVAVMVAAWAGPARAGIIEPELAIDGGTGVPGGTVAVTLSLSDDIADVGVSAGIDLRFPTEALEFFEPVVQSCAVAERISETHGVAGRLVAPDLLNLEVFVSGAPNPPPPLGNGEIVTCDFRIKEGVPAGTVALEIEDPFLGDAEGQQVPARIRNGSVQVVESFPTSTPTATATPSVTNTPTATVTTEATATATATITATPAVTNTATATATLTNTVPTIVATATSTATSGVTNTPTASATATRTGQTATPTKKKSDNDDGCNVGPVDTTGTPGAAALLLLPALLLWVRRHSE
jgi:MYXO-CTERM domain-containing protein